MNVVAFLTLLIVAVVLAALQGGAPERWTAGMFALAALATRLILSDPTQRYYMVEPFVAAVDLILLLGITIILAKADRFWPIAVFAVHGVSVLAHIVKLLDVSIIRHAYKIAIVAPSYVAVLTLIVGVMRHQQRLRTYGADLDWSDHA